MIGQLTEIADRYRLEAGICADAGAFQAGIVMMGCVLEAMLFCSVGMSEHVLRAKAHWPAGETDPFKWELGRLVDIAKRAGWFAQEAFPGARLEEVIEWVNDVRICSVHPAAYIRDGAYFATEQEFAAVFAVLTAADHALGEVIRTLPDPPPQN